MVAQIFDRKPNVITEKTAKTSSSSLIKLQARAKMRKKKLLLQIVGARGTQQNCRIVLTSLAFSRHLVKVFCLCLVKISVLSILDKPKAQHSARTEFACSNSKERGFGVERPQVAWSANETTIFECALALGTALALHYILPNRLSPTQSGPVPAGGLDLTKTQMQAEIVD